LILDEIIESKRAEVAWLAGAAADLEAAAAAAGPPRGFDAALRAPGSVSVIAEFKRRSPSEGDINPYADVAGVARAYERGGAAAASVLTDGPYFGGELADLRRARDASGLPLLRKDFLIDPLQLYESRAAGADAVLLIVKALSDGTLRELRAGAEDLGMSALVEAHDAAEIERALDAGARIVGVNARDLQTFDVDLEASLNLIEEIPGDVIAVAESGVRGGADVERAGRAGADAVLVGGWLMKSDPRRGVEELAGHRRRPRAGCEDPAGTPFDGEEAGDTAWSG
jgi:indole-3-glycerol phosphate synthase